MFWWRFKVSLSWWWLMFYAGYNRVRQNPELPVLRSGALCLIYNTTIETPYCANHTKFLLVNSLLMEEFIIMQNPPSQHISCWSFHLLQEFVVSSYKLPLMWGIRLLQRWIIKLTYSRAAINKWKWNVHSKTLQYDDFFKCFLVSLLFCLGLS